MKNILVSGGSGFIGSNIVELLQKKNFKVLVLDKKKPNNLKAKFIRSDISNLSKLTKLTKKIDYIFHLAGVSNINKVKGQPILTIKDNIISTTSLLEFARIKKVKRFLFASSIYAHGDAGNLYTTSKIAAENIIRNYSLLYNLKYTILRYATVYGTYNRGADVISLFLKNALQNKNISVHSNGKQTRDFIHAEDVAECSIKALDRKFENKTLTIGNKKKVKIIDIAKMIKKISKAKSTINVNKTKKRLDDFNLNEIKKIPTKSYLKYKSKYSLKKGIEKLYKESI